MAKLAPRVKPCSSCPYRRDAPSGLWDAREYAKLPAYDLDTAYQPLGLFMCHSSPDWICSGWAACHDLTVTLAIRLSLACGEVDRAITEYSTTVPLFSSGAEAAAHGLRDLESPSSVAIVKATQLERLIGRRQA